jgi:molybdopterin-guanine dinucleotide biosynthesis protein A
MSEATSAVVLAGGRSRRLGQDKRALRLGSSRPLLVETVAQVGGLVDEVVVVVGRDPALVETWCATAGVRARVVEDRVPDHGPLGGLQAGLLAATREYALVVACDLPFLEPAVLRLLLGWPRPYDLLVPRRADGRLEMLLAIYHRACLATVEAHLAQNRLRLGDLAATLAGGSGRVCYLEEAVIRPCDPDLRTFTNLNTPTDLQSAAQRLSRRE